MAHKTAHEKVTAWLPVGTKQQLEELAADNGRSVASEIRMALAAWLKERTA